MSARRRFYEAIVKVPHPKAAIRMARKRYRVRVHELERTPWDGLTEIAIEGRSRRHVLVYLVDYLGWDREGANEKIRVWAVG